jgi:hypothetical protein
MTRAAAKAIAKLLVGVLVAVQLMVAAYACPWLARGPDSTTAATATPAGDAGASHAAARPSCHESMPSMDPAQPNLCAEHCKYGQQSDRCASIDVPVALLSPLYATVGAPSAAPRPCISAWLSALVAASPPHAIAHCVWRI